MPIDTDRVFDKLPTELIEINCRPPPTEVVKV